MKSEISCLSWDFLYLRSVALNISHECPGILTFHKVSFSMQHGIIVIRSYTNLFLLITNVGARLMD